MEATLNGRQISRDAAPVSLLLVLCAAVLAAFFGAYQLLESYVLAPRLEPEVLHLLHIVRGITGSVLLAAFVAYYLMRHPGIAFSSRERTMTAIGRHEREWDHVRWFITMRWVAAAFTLALIIIAVPLTSILSPVHLPRLLGWWGVLIAANMFFSARLGSARSVDTEIITQIVVDLIILSGLLNASGGVENPLSIAYLFHVIIASILLPSRKSIAVAITASGIFTALAAGELFHVLPHSTMLLFPHGPEPIHEMIHAAHDVAFVTGRVVSFVGVMLLTSYFTTLVTERLRQSEADLEQAAHDAVLDRRRLEGIIDAAALGIVVTGPTLTVEWFNQRLASWMGWSARTLGAPLAHAHTDDESPCLACLADETFRIGEQNEAEVRTQTGNGAVRYFRHVASPIRGGQGEVAQVVDVVEDITHRKALEAEALHAGRLSVLGQLAAGVAHEIGNPLSSLQARLQLMRRSADPQFIHDSLQVLQTQIDRIGRIVRGVSHLARNRRDALVTVELNSVVSEALSLVKLDSRSAKLRFTEKLQEPLPMVRGVREQLLQVLINLLLNAVEATPEGGVIETSTFDMNGTVCVNVADSGAGIEESVRARLFEPFFTTKHDGTGLGLSICYSLITAHGGTIGVRSEPGTGSRFTVQLPAKESERT